MNGYGYGNNQGGPSRRPYGGRGRRPDSGGGRGYASRDAGPRRHPPRHVECPAELRAPFKDARDFLAGLI